MTPLDFTEFAIRHKGEPISLDRRPWLPTIYNLPFTVQPDDTFRRKQLLIFGRQCEKSTTIANMLMSCANLVDYLRLLYITASDVQMREFSDERLRAVIADSSRLLDLAGQTQRYRARSPTGQKETQNVQTKRWVNQSKILLRSVYRSADRARGISSDFLGVDELQDIYTDTLPVIEETLFHSELAGGPISLYAGTPKTFDNPLEFYWSRHSTQNEWMVKCEGCGKWTLITEEHIHPTGLFCLVCTTELNPVTGQAQWVRLGREDSEWEGFRLPQPVVIYAYRNEPQVFTRQWMELLNKRRRYPRAKFQNEVMARSYDAGTKPVTFEEVRKCCISTESFVGEDDIDVGLRTTQTWAGVDWGTGEVSYTVASVWRYDASGRFACIWAKKYEGVEADPDFQIGDMIQWFRRFNVNRIGSDWGFGFQANPKLQKAFGAGKVLCYYHAGKQGEKVRWDKKGVKFTTHRTRVLGDVFTLIKRGPVSGGMAFPKWEQFEEFSKDILAVYQEHDDTRGELRYDHPRGVPDDFLHTACYALLASQFDKRRPDLHNPQPSRSRKK